MAHRTARTSARPLAARQPDAGQVFLLWSGISTLGVMIYPLVYLTKGWSGLVPSGFAGDQMAQGLAAVLITVPMAVAAGLLTATFQSNLLLSFRPPPADQSQRFARLLLLTSAGWVISWLILLGLGTSSWRLAGQSLLAGYQDHIEIRAAAWLGVGTLIAVLQAVALRLSWVRAIIWAGCHMVAWALAGRATWLFTPVDFSNPASGSTSANLSADFQQGLFSLCGCLLVDRWLPSLIVGVGSGLAFLLLFALFPPEPPPVLPSSPGSS